MTDNLVKAINDLRKEAKQYEKSINDLCIKREKTSGELYIKMTHHIDKNEAVYSTLIYVSNKLSNLLLDEQEERNV
jgi:hypothetical protein